MITKATTCLPLLIALVLSLAKATDSYPIDKDSLICPDSNPLNCYPKLFEPAIHWKPILDGQMIPAGLDIRLNIDTLVKEAKLPDENQDPDGADDKGVVLVGDSEQQTFEVGLDKEEEELTPEKQQAKFDSLNQKFKNRKKSKSSMLSEPDFTTSLNYVVSYVAAFSTLENKQEYFDTLMENFDSLSELSSDLDFGIEIMENLQPFLKLSGIYDTEALEGLSAGQMLKIEEVSVRVLSASVRNNKLAQELFKAYFVEPVEFLSKLATLIEGEDLLLIKRKLGLLSSLIMNGAFKKEFEQGAIESKLLKLYNEVSDEGLKGKIIQILADLDTTKLEKREFTEGEEDEEDEVDNQVMSHDKKYAIIAQDAIVRAPLASHQDTKLLLDSLKDLKEKDRKLFKASPDFLNWLSHQIELHRVPDVQKRQEGQDVDGFTEYLIQLRHEVFGNKLGTRKEYLDQL